MEDPSQLESWNQEVQAKLDQVRQDLREAALRISESVNQRVEELNRDVQEKLQAVQNVFDNVSGGLTALGDKLGRYQDAIQSTGTTLGGAIQLSATLRGDLGKAVGRCGAHCHQRRLPPLSGRAGKQPRGAGRIPVRPHRHGDGARV